MEVLSLVQNAAQECIRHNPLILLGSGASAAHGIPGMWQLGEYLRKTQLPSDLNPGDATGWDQFLSTLSTTDLESALTQVTLSQRMTSHVVTSTWDYLNGPDLTVFEQVCVNRNHLALTKLFQHLFQSTHREIHVITPNYDRLAEYAAEAAGFAAFTGFTFGVIGIRAPNPGPKICYGKIQARTVNVWKVHGSFGWFCDDKGAILSLPPSRVRPTGFQPIIITPGVEKYRRTHEEPFRTAMQRADDAIRAANSFLCIGYGFNDSHIQTLIIERCQAQSVPLVLITKEISKPALQFLKEGGCLRYLALEESGTGTRVYCSELPDGTLIENCSIWQLAGFLNLVM